MEGMQLEPRRVALERRRGIWPERVITEYLDRWVATRPEALAVAGYRDADGGTTRLTWRELGARVAAMAAVLAARGIGRGDVVSFQLPNWWEFVAVHLACVRLGAVSNPLMPIFRQREMSFMLRHAGAKVLIAPARFRGFDHAALARALGGTVPSLEHVLLVGGDGPESLEAALHDGARAGPAAAHTALRPDDPVQLLFTSGTTGEPKGALHTSNTLLGTILQFAVRLRMSDADVVFMPSPLAHQAGFAYGLTLSVLLGVPLVLLDVWKPAAALALMERYGATYTFGATPFLADLAGFPGIERRRPDGFRLFVSSGAPIPPALVRQAQERLGAAIVPSWGMTECCSATTTDLTGYKALESDGWAVPGGEIRVADEDGRELPRGREGTLQYRGAALFVGYLKRPQLYTVDADGWFDTGDIARMDAQGYVRICGRRKDIIIRGGENVPVIEIESALYRLPQVAEVALVAMPDARMGERACAFVALRPGAHLAMEDVQRFLATEGFSKHFWPERLEIMEQLPHTPTGKVQKYALREIAQRLAPADAAAPAAG